MSSERSQQETREAAAILSDVAAEQVAAVYAEAFLGAATAAGRADALVAELDSLVTDVLEPFPELEKILASAVVAHEEKEKVLDHVLGGQADPLVLSFLKVLSSRGRLDCLRAVRRQVHAAYERMQGQVRVRVSTAAPLDPALAGRIAEALRPILPGEPVLEEAVEPGLIGGIVVRVGDTVYDASIATQLENLRQQIVDRSAHEIQSRRDRFRYPG
jgi:F-type H+-transporting ATPase subunit delta